MLVSFSTYQSHDDRRVVVLGEQFPGIATAEKRDFRALQPCLEQWVKKEGFTLLGEHWFEPAPAESAANTDSNNNKKKKSKADAAVRLEKAVEEALQTGMHTDQRLSSKLLSPFLRASSPAVQLVDSRPFAYLLNFVLMCVHFWKPLGKDVDEETDGARERAFLQKSRDITFAELRSLTEQAVSRLRASLAALKAKQQQQQKQSLGVSNLEAASKLIEERLQQVTVALQLMADFEKMYGAAATPAATETAGDTASSSSSPSSSSSSATSSSDDDDKSSASSSSSRYAPSFFAAVHAVQDEAIQAWQVWAEPLGTLMRDVLLWEAVLQWAAEADGGLSASSSAVTTSKEKTGETAATTAAAAAATTKSKRLVVVCENTQAIAVSELLTRIGFVCRGFSGSLERMSPYTKLSAAYRPPEPFEQKMLTRMLASAVDFPKSGDDVTCCSFCGRAGTALSKCSRCLAAAYCNQDCQRQHWKTHKPDCKPADPAAVAAAKAKAAANAAEAAATSEAKASVGKHKGKR